MNNLNEVQKPPRVFNYESYKSLLKELLECRKSTGEEQSMDRLQASKLNVSRIKRGDKNYQASAKMVEAMGNVKRKMVWVLLLEGWCGDGAQCVPMIAKAAELSPQVELRILLRDENPELMDAHLTNGGRAIPYLICYDLDSGKELGAWGPRPQELIALIQRVKLNNPNIEKPLLLHAIHKWYAEDKGQSIDRELSELVADWSVSRQAMSV